MSDTTETGVYEDYGEAPPARRRRRDPNIRYDPRVSGDKGAFREAVRHSRVVRWLRFVLPALVLLAAGVFWATIRFVPSGFDDLVSISGIDIESNSVTMDRPLISGFEGTRRAYQVKADNAVQSLSDPKVITFNGIDANIGLGEAGTATIRAGVGVYDGNHNTLRLSEGISIETSDGYAAKFTAADIDLDGASLVSDQPLAVSSKDGTLTANGVRVSDRGKRVIFVNGVSLKFVPPGDLMTVPPAATGAGQ